MDKRINSEYKIIIAEVDCVKSDALCLDQNIMKFPSLIIYINGEKAETFPDWRAKNQFQFRSFLAEFVNPQSAFTGTKIREL